MHLMRSGLTYTVILHSTDSSMRLNLRSFTHVTHAIPCNLWLNLICKWAQAHERYEPRLNSSNNWYIEHDNGNDGGDFKPTSCNCQWDQTQRGESRFWESQLQVLATTRVSKWKKILHVNWTRFPIHVILFSVVNCMRTLRIHQRA